MASTCMSAPGTWLHTSAKYTLLLLKSSGRLPFVTSRKWVKLFFSSEMHSGETSSPSRAH